MDPRGGWGSMENGDGEKFSPAMENEDGDGDGGNFGNVGQGVGTTVGK